MIDYISVDEKLRKYVSVTMAVRGMFERSDHYVVLAKIKIKGIAGKMTRER